MRQFLNTLFVLSEDAYLTLDGENVVVSRGKAEVGRVPLHTLESVLQLRRCQPCADGQMRAYGHRPEFL